MHVSPIVHGIAEYLSLFNKCLYIPRILISSFFWLFSYFVRWSYIWSIQLINERIPQKWTTLFSDVPTSSRCRTVRAQVPKRNPLLRDGKWRLLARRSGVHSECVRQQRWNVHVGSKPGTLKARMNSWRVVQAVEGSYKHSEYLQTVLTAHCLVPANFKTYW